jgi:hypothetical protein
MNLVLLKTLLSGEIPGTDLEAETLKQRRADGGRVRGSEAATRA